MYVGIKRFFDLFELLRIFPAIDVYENEFSDVQFSFFASVAPLNPLTVKYAS